MTKEMTVKYDPAIEKWGYMRENTHLYYKMNMKNSLLGISLVLVFPLFIFFTILWFHVYFLFSFLFSLFSFFFFLFSFFLFFFFSFFLFFFFSFFLFFFFSFFLFFFFS